MQQDHWLAAEYLRTFRGALLMWWRSSFLTFQVEMKTATGIIQDHLLPAEYVRTFRGALLDKCPVSPPTEVRSAETA